MPHFVGTSSLVFLLSSSPAVQRAVSSSKLSSHVYVWQYAGSRARASGQKTKFASNAALQPAMLHLRTTACRATLQVGVMASGVPLMDPQVAQRGIGAFVVVRCASSTAATAMARAMCPANGSAGGAASEWSDGCWAVSSLKYSNSSDGYAINQYPFLFNVRRRCSQRVERRLPDCSQPQVRRQH